MRLIDNLVFQQNTSVLNEMSSGLFMQGVDVQWNITGLNCVVHTLQLVIKDALKTLAKKYRNVIDLCRRAAKFLRLKSCHYEMNAAGIHYKLIRLDVETRWGSTFN